MDSLEETFASIANVVSSIKRCISERNVSSDDRLIGSTDGIVYCTTSQ